MIFMLKKSLKLKLFFYFFYFFLHSPSESLKLILSESEFFYSIFGKNSFTDNNINTSY